MLCLPLLAIATPLTGTKTIGGTTPDYATFTAAVADLQTNGVGTGGVTFSVRSGTYNERITINPVTGASSGNPIIFVKESGTVTIAAAGTTATNCALVTLHGADWITFDGIDVQDIGTGTNLNKYGYLLNSHTDNYGASHNTIQNLHITLQRTTANCVGIALLSTFNAPEGDNYNKLLNLKISNCQIGVRLDGDYITMSNYNEVGSTSTDVADANRFVIGSGGADDIRATGLYIHGQNNLIVHDIDVCNVTNLTAQPAFGVRFGDIGMGSQSNMGVCDFYRNRIYNISSRSSNTTIGVTKGISFEELGGYLTVYHIYDNFMWNLQSRNNGTGSANTLAVIGISSTDYDDFLMITKYHIIDHNTILLNLASYRTHCASTVMYLMPGTNDIHNNIIANITPNPAGGNNHTAMQDWAYLLGMGIVRYDYNLYYLSSTNPCLGITWPCDDRDPVSIEYTLAEWQVAPLNHVGEPNDPGRILDPHSIAGNPLFVNEDTAATDLHIQTNSGSPANNAATVVTWITTDIDGQTRSVTTPDIGADEGNFEIDYTQPQSNNSGPGNSNSWVPTLPPDPALPGGTHPAVNIAFPPAVEGTNPTSVTVRRDTPDNAINNWGVDRTQMTLALPGASSLNRVWEISETGGSNFMATILLYFVAADLPAGITDPVNQITEAKSKHGTNPWMTYPCVVTGPDGDGVYTATISGVSQFSVWGLHSNQVLPVEMTSFTAVAGNRRVTLRWRTETETNNDHYVLYRSTNAAMRGDVVAQVAGHGTTVTAHNYMFTDTRVQNGMTYYYRISDVDIQGVEELHPMVVHATPSIIATDIPTEFALVGNYPNPFNSSTTIQFAVPVKSEIRIDVFNTNGEFVGNVVTGTFNVGFHSVNWNANLLNSGTYFYRLTSGKTTVTKKLVFMK